MSTNRSKNASKNKSQSQGAGEEEGNNEGGEEYAEEEEGGNEQTNSKNKSGTKSKLQNSADASNISKNKSASKAGKSKDGSGGQSDENASQASKKSRGKSQKGNDSQANVSQQDASTLRNANVMPNNVGASQKGPSASKPPLPQPEPKIINALVVTITSCEFSKDYNYFIALQLGKNGDKKRTEVSQEVRNPAFRTNSFTLPLENHRIEHYQEIYFSSFIVLNVEEYSREHADQEHAGEARLLGECVLNLIPLKSQIYDPVGQGVKQALKFTRKSEKGEITVGRFVVNIKYVGKSIEPPKEESVVVSQMVPEPVEEKNPNMSEIVRPLPKNDGYLFHWRVRVEIRSGVDLPYNRDTPKGLPSAFVEAGIADQINIRPPDETLQITKTIPEERNPIWNTQLMLIRYQEQDPSKNVWLFISVKDKGIKSGTALETMFIPVNKMVPFFPYNFEFAAASFEFKNKAKYYISFVLEEIDPKSKLEQYADIVVHKAVHDPLPAKLKRMWIAMTLFGYSPSQITFHPVDLEKTKELGPLVDSVAKENNQKRVFLSSMLKIPSAEVVHLVMRD
jgi:hypothetical protein